MSNNLYRGYIRWRDRNQDISALPWLFIGIVVLMMIATRGRFMGSSNVSNVLAQVPELGLLSLAMMAAMITAGINLSIISTANLSAVIMALFLTTPAAQGASGVSAVLVVLGAILIGIVVSALLGAVNGYLIGYIEVPAVLTTLGTMIVFEGVTLAITQGYVISGMPNAFLVLGNARILGIPFQMFVFAAAAAIFALIVKRRPYGVHLYFIGSNPTATDYSGIDIRKVLLRTYILSGILSGIAAVVMLSRFNSANARQGSSMLLSTVLICMLGGTDPFGGFGKVSGLVIALFLLQMVTSGLNLLGVSSFATVAIWGIMLIGVMAYRYFQKGSFEKKRKKEQLGSAS
ncbi:MAG: ABC transporter permease [Spirochaetia bacterium]|nr:ABC transporter permease [Spirochaetia bacterium]